MEQSQELTKRMEEAVTDSAWAEKLCAAGDWDTYAALLGEKGIQPPAELRAVLEAAQADKGGKLEDVELEQVSGGAATPWFCAQQYVRLLCDLIRCPLAIRLDDTPDSAHYTYYCRLGFWHMVVAEGESYF